MEAAEGIFGAFALHLSKKGFFKFTLFFLLLVSLMVAWLGFGERGFVHLYRMEKERAVHIERISRLERENQDLLEEIQRLRTDQGYIEAMGRRELGLVKNEEILYRFEKNEKEADSGSPSKPEPEK
jgi:cell division protein FtsB